MNIDQDLEKQLTRVYVALAVTRDIAERGVNDKPADPALGSLLTFLDVASEMLEQILDPPLTVPTVASVEEVSEVDAIM